MIWCQRPDLTAKHFHFLALKLFLWPMNYLGLEREHIRLECMFCIHSLRFNPLVNFQDFCPLSPQWSGGSFEGSSFFLGWFDTIWFLLLHIQVMRPCCFLWFPTCLLQWDAWFLLLCCQHCSWIFGLILQSFLLSCESKERPVINITIESFQTFTMDASWELKPGQVGRPSHRPRGKQCSVYFSHFSESFEGWTETQYSCNRPEVVIRKSRNKARAMVQQVGELSLHMADLHSVPGTTQGSLNPAKGDPWV